MTRRARTFLLVAGALCLPVLLLAQHAKEDAKPAEGKPAMAPAKKMTDAQKAMMMRDNARALYRLA